jgi:hypothetical protein
MAVAAAAAAAAAAPKLGEHKLLRTKHIDTLEVLEEYSQERDKLQKENKSLQQQIIKLTGLSGDPYSRISQLESSLINEQTNNAQLQGRIAVLEQSADRQRSELSFKEAALRDATTAAAAVKTELESLRSTHERFTSERQSTVEEIASLQRVKEDLQFRVTAGVQQLEEYKTMLATQSEKVRSMEFQATAGSAPTVTAAAELEVTRLLKAQQARIKDQLREKEAALVQQQAQAEQLRIQLSAASSASSQRDVTIQRLQDAQKKLQSDLAAYKAEAAANSARRQNGVRDEQAKRDREWVAEKKELQAQLEAARKAAAAANTAANSANAAARAATVTAAAAAASPLISVTLPPARVSKSEQELRELVAHLQSEVVSFKSQAEHLHSQNGVLRSEYEKVSSAFNQLLASGAATTALGVGRAARSSDSGSTITIASKKTHFPEFIALKRENDGLHTQIADLRHALHVLHAHIGSGDDVPLNAATQAAVASQIASAAPAVASPAGLLRRRAQSSLPKPTAIPAADANGQQSARVSSQNSTIAAAASSAPLVSNTHARSFPSSTTKRLNVGWPAAAAPLNARR